MGRGLSKRQRRVEEMTERVYAFIKAYIDERGIAPSRVEIARAVFLSRSGVLRYIDRLEARGQISHEPGIPRSIRLLRKR